MGESHLFDIEQQQQLQHLHSWQERSKENAQPGRRGKMSLPGSEPGETVLGTATAPTGLLGTTRHLPAEEGATPGKNISPGQGLPIDQLQHISGNIKLWPLLCLQPLLQD